MWIAGVMQGLMWREVNEDGTLANTFVQALDATWPFYVGRLLGGVVLLLGDARHGLQRVPDDQTGAGRRRDRSGGRRSGSELVNHDLVEKNIGLMLALVIAVISLGGLAEIVPLFYQDEVIEPIPGAAAVDRTRTRGARSLHPRRLRGLSFADDPAAPGRDPAIRPLLRRRRERLGTIRSSSARSEPAPIWRASACATATNGIVRI